MIDIRKQLETILDILDDKEWIQGDLFEGPHGLRGDQGSVPLDEVTGVCLAGAYSYAHMTGMMVIGDWPKVSSVLLAVAEDLFPDRHPDSIPHFNDNKETTVEDIRLVVKTAIEKVSEVN